MNGAGDAIDLEAVQMHHKKSLTVDCTLASACMRTHTQRQ